MKIINIHNKKKTVYLFSRDEKGNQIIRKDNDFFPFYYEPHSEGNFRGYDGVPLKKIFVSEPSDVPKLRSEKSYSADIIYTNNYMIHKVDTIEPCILKYIFIDIEVLAKEFPEPSKAKYPVSCITIYNSMTKEYKTWSLFETKEEVLLNNCLDHIKKEAPDLILAWNVDFDYIYIYNRCSKFKINFPKFISPINQVRLGGVKDIFYPAGISIVDYSGNKMKAGLFSKVYMREPTYALDYIGEKYLKRGKKYKNPYFGSINKEVILRNIDDVKMMVAEYDRRRKVIVRGLNNIGFECHEPKGAFYTFPSIQTTGLSSEDFTEKLLREERVAVMPGNLFGEQGEGFIRCCYAADMSDIEEALNRMARFAKRYQK